MKPIYLIIFLVIGMGLTTCASAQQETVRMYGPIELGARFIPMNGHPVQPWHYSTPVQPDPGLFPARNISVPIPTGNAILDFLQLAILAFLAWRVRRSDIDLRDYEFTGKDGR